jgi:hypothetical protein
MSKEQIKEFVIYGTPEDIQRQIEARTSWYPISYSEF